MTINNSEHAEATQAETDALRKEKVALYKPEVQDNFRAIEQFCEDMSKRDLPFMLLINPHGHDFSDHKNGYGIWRWQRFHSNKEDRFSKEGVKKINQMAYWILFHFCSFMSGIYARTGFGLAILSKRRPITIYEDGICYEQKNNENE